MFNKKWGTSVGEELDDPDDAVVVVAGSKTRAFVGLGARGLGGKKVKHRKDTLNKNHVSLRTRFVILSPTLRAEQNNL